MRAPQSKYREKFLDNWYETNTIGFFIVLCLLYFASYFIKRAFIIDEIAAFEVLQDRGEMFVMDIFFGLQYLSVPLFLLWKFCITTFILWVGCFLFGYRLTYTEIWKMVMIMELVFLVPELLKVVWFTLYHTDPSYHDVTAYYPLSMINFFDYEKLNPRWIYPLKALNLFEIIYWVLLGAGIYWLSGKKIKTSVIIVSTSYSLFFLLWLIFYLSAYR